jgi:hypothetical protein
VKIGEIYSVTFSLPMIESTQLFVLEMDVISCTTPSRNNFRIKKFKLRPLKSIFGFSSDTIPLESVSNISVASDKQIIECLDDMVKWQLYLK